MRRIPILVVVAVVAAVFISAVAYAAPETAKQAAKEEKPAIVDVGNKICPVTGDAVNGKDFYEYKGKRYGFCCPMCPPIFAGDPEKYSAIADKEVAAR